MKSNRVGAKLKFETGYERDCYEEKNPNKQKTKEKMGKLFIEMENQKECRDKSSKCQMKRQCKEVLERKREENNAVMSIFQMAYSANKCYC